MTDQDATADSCPIIDEFIGQGTPAALESSQTQQTGSVGCAILTEFSDQGKPTNGGAATTDPADSISSTSQGCEAVTTFSDIGFVAANAAPSPTGAEKNGGGVSREQAPAKREA